MSGAQKGVKKIMVKKRIGIDVGGTNVKIALVTDEGQIIYSNSVPTRAEMGYEYTVNNSTLR